MPPDKLPPRPILVVVIGAGAAAGSYMAHNPWPMAVAAGLGAAALAWVAFRKSA